MDAAGGSNRARPLIAHLISRLSVGGLEKGVVTLINRMPPDRYRHAVIAINFIDEFAKRIERPDVELVALNKGPGKDPKAYARLYQVFRRMRPDVVHSRNLAALDAQWIAFLAGVPARLHGENGRDVHDLDGANFRYNLLRRAVRPFIHHYSAVSRDLADWLIRTVRVPPRRVHQIYNGVNGEIFQPRNRPRSPLDAEGRFPPDCCVIGTVGRMKEVKNQVLLVDAFLLLIAQRPDLRGRLRLLIVGDGPLRADCLARLEAAAATDLAWLPGERSDIPEMLRAMDLFVLPSLAEGISNTILEAMACGLPVIATCVGGNPELVAEGRTGALVPVSDPGAMAAALARYADHLELVLAHGRTARAEVEARFTVEAMVAGYTRFYEQALAETRS